MANARRTDTDQMQPLYQKVKDFITFALSRKGREVIKKAGSVPYSDAMGLVMKQIEQYAPGMGLA